MVMIANNRNAFLHSFTFLSSSTLVLLIIAGFFFLCNTVIVHGGSGHGLFSIREASIHDIQLAFTENLLTSRELVNFYLKEIQTLNPILRAVIEVNPDVLDQADKADRQRRRWRTRNDRYHHHQRSTSQLGEMHGIPILLKDNIATKDKLNTTAGSFALLGSVVPRDAGVVKRLRRSGALIMGKASLSEWANFRGSIPSGWCGRTGQGKNPYVLSGDPCGSSSGSAISVASNLVSVSLGTETDGSIICPARSNSVVGIKPTVGLTSRSGVIPITPRQDTVGPICRTVSDAVYVLDAIVGFDPLDMKVTRKARKFIPEGGYKQFLKEEGLQGKRLGIVRNPFFNFPKGSILFQTFQGHLETLRLAGVVLVDNLEIHNVDVIIDSYQSGEFTAMLAEFKQSLNAYFKELITSPVRSLSDLIAFNLQNPSLEKTDVFGQDIFVEAQNTTGTREATVKLALEKMKNLSRDGFERMMMENELDAMVTPGVSASTVLAIGGYPGISVPAGYDREGMPIGICFGGLSGSEPKLIEIAYAFEQLTLIRKPPVFRTITASSH